MSGPLVGPLPWWQAAGYAADVDVYAGEARVWWRETERDPSCDECRGMWARMTLAWAEEALRRREMGT